MSDHPNYRDEIAAEIIGRIEKGTAPWQKPWQAGTLGAAPFNPISGNPYRGINDVWLTLQGRGDPRWMTYRQALEQDAQVRKGEKSTTIEYWQWTERQALTGQDGKPLLDGEGRERFELVRLERPKVFYAKVFNGEQIDGLQPYVPPPAQHEIIRMVRAEAMISSANVPVFHDQRDRAYYSPASDDIHLPDRASFRDHIAYYETTLHELGHATGHRSRLNRAFGPFGSEGYAKEELRAEIASYMLARDLGISFDPGNHAAYVESWLKVLRDDRNEIFRAARDAETIKTWVMEPEKRPELEQAAQIAKAAAIERPVKEEREPKQEAAMPEERKPRIYIAVPYAEKDEAKAAGAKWDRAGKSWYIPEGTDPAAFTKWAGKDQAPGPDIDPVKEFAEALKANGLIIKGDPAMDGEWHRVQVDGDKKGQLNGSYRGFLDGKPAGQITNYKAGGTVQWVATGMALTDEQRAKIQAEAAQVRAGREQAVRQAAEKSAKIAYGVWVNLPGDATQENCKYLQNKGVHGYGVKVNPEGQMVVPCRDADGRLWNIQTIGPNGKRFLKDSRKEGTMHVLEPSGKGTLDALRPTHRDGVHQPAIIIAEGYATAATIFERTGRPVVSAFDSGNLLAVAEAVRAKFPNSQILIAADNDHSNKLGNVGMTKAEEAAKAVAGLFVAPRFRPEEMAKGLTDFNDLAQARGGSHVAAVIEGAISRSRGQERGVA
ncbi:zincin-like metallopeptidase domain-containing protein [Magnetospirillum sp. 15-1]|uniref:zincin-like metallopeptidase domain-containing protein n=1 Tax=Magnetospirillum sp. 15-1 TaxID=1979370 RepID=UPI000BBBF4B9|nr:zincin-like metallopeptidase domain-containing protein [Magnetospirillum sp. 15-1]